MTEKYCNNPTTANEITDHYPAIQLTIEIYTNGHKKYGYKIIALYNL